MLLPAFVPVYQRPKPEVDRHELVVLLHGIFTTGLRLFRLHRRLLAEGYTVLSVTYPSRMMSMEGVAAWIVAPVKHYLQSDEKLHLVGYSMGGLVARAYAQRDDTIKPESMVLIASPNQGTEYVDGMLGNPITAALFKQIAGEPGLDMRTVGGIADRLGPVPEGIDLGVIAGDAGIELWPPMPGKHDGQVTVERTKVEGMKDFIVLPYDHVWVVQSRPAVDNVIHFLGHRTFIRCDDQAASALPQRPRHGEQAANDRLSG